MIKILILFAIIALSTLVGVILSSNKKRKSEFYSQLYEFNESLILNLKFGKISINKIAKDYPLVEKILQGKQDLLINEEFINNYIQNLGHTDAVSQIDYLNEKSVYLKKYKDDSINDYKKYGSLYIKVFFMVGILVAVLLY